MKREDKKKPFIKKVDRLATPCHNSTCTEVENTHKNTTCAGHPLPQPNYTEDEIARTKMIFLVMLRYFYHSSSQTRDSLTPIFDQIERK